MSGARDVLIALLAAAADEYVIGRGPLVRAALHLAAEAVSSEAIPDDTIVACVRAAGPQSPLVEQALRELEAGHG